MNTELVEKLKQSSEKLLEFIEKTSEQTVEFTKEQVPLVVQEVLNWGFYSNLAYAINFLIISIFCLVINFKAFELAKKYDRESDGFSWIGFIITSVPTPVFIIHTFSYMMVCLKICVAPRLYLLESLREIIK